MKYKNLGTTDIKVSSICLGTMTWGEQNTLQDAHHQLDYALDNGVNFIDTAEMYPVPPKPETYSVTEQYIGRWEKLKTQRDKIVLATKIAGPADWLPYVRGGNNKLNKENIKLACEASLKRLGTDYIDLYQLHWPNRSTNFFGQLDFQYDSNEDYISPLESLEALQELVKEGKVRNIGLSNETAWGAMKYLSHGENSKLPRIMSIQNPYNLLNRTYEIALSEVSIREQTGLLAYSPLAFGVLSGKYLRGQKPENARLTLFDRFTRYLGEKPEKAVSAYENIAKKHGISLAQLSLAFIASKDFVTSTIIGATTMEQLKENIETCTLVLSSEVIKEVNAVHQKITNPCP